MRAIRSGKGIGDNLYLQSIVRHLVEKGQQLEVCTHYPDLFRPLAAKVRLSAWRRDRIDLVSHYIDRKTVSGTDQFVDCCIRCGIKERIDLRLDWPPLNGALVQTVLDQCRPVVIVQMPREPMGRTDGYGADLLPDCRTLQRIIDHIGARAKFVQIGAGSPLFRFRGIDRDLANKTSISDLIDVAWAADAALGYCSFVVPLAESLAKPALLVWSRRGLNSATPFIRQITPAKIVHRPATTHVLIDDCADSELQKVADAFLDQAAGTAALRGQDGRDCRVGAGLRR